MTATKQCEWCAEEILSEARKCKHCGEMVGTSPPEQGAPRPAVPQCPHCAYQPTSSRDAFLHEANVHTGRSATGAAVATSARRSPPSGYSGRTIGRDKLSKVGAKTDGGLACPK